MRVIEKEVFKPLSIELYDSVDVEIMRTILKIADVKVGEMNNGDSFCGVFKDELKEHINYLVSKI